MSEIATSEMHVIKKDDKYTVLRGFISQDLEVRGQLAVSAGDPLTYCLIARSPLSPVARALASLSEKISAHGISVTAVFTTVADYAAKYGIDQRRRGAPDQSRLIQDPRLMEAHEALLLGDRASWIGDCMRRDPALNDAYERFACNCDTTNASVNSAFTQLWTGARPIACNWLSVCHAAPNLADGDMIATSALRTAEEPSLRVPVTRH